MRLLLVASKKKQIQTLEHAVNYLVASTGVLMDSSTCTLSVLSVIGSGGRCYLVS